MTSMRKFAILALGSSGEALSSAMCLVGTRRFSEASRQGELRFVLESLRPTALQLRRSCHRTCLVLGGRGTARELRRCEKGPGGAVVTRNRRHVLSNCCT